MPRIDDVPDGFKPYLFHGVDLDYGPNDKEAWGDCPYCDREQKFSVNYETSKGQCKKCGEGKNASEFIKWVHSISFEQTDDYSEIMEHRGLSHDALVRWGVARSHLTGDWLVPGYNAEGSMVQLYRYIKMEKLFPTPTLSHGIHGVNLTKNRASAVCLCEGPWDGMALWDGLRNSIETEDGELTTTASEKKSLLKDVNVLAVPGCNVFFDRWGPLFEDKIVNLMFDNDHPRTHKKTGKAIPPAGLVGMKRVGGMLSVRKKKSTELNYLKWGPEGYNLDLLSGTDLRDTLGDQSEDKYVPQQVAYLLEKLAPIPEEWVSEAKSKTKEGKRKQKLKCLECDSYAKMIDGWSKAMEWTPGLDYALSVMLASVTSTKSVGDQLWVKVIGPASCGKSTLCEAISVNTDYVIAKSTIRGFHSGFKSDGDGEEDNSLVSKLYDMTLVTKDGDTLLQSPNLSQILSEARDIYDSVSRTHYRNKLSKDYMGLRMTWLLCGTSSLRSIDESELGERFLDCVIMEGIDDDEEDLVLPGVADQSIRNLGIEADGKPESQYEPAKAKVMQLTGGYVEHLRRNATGLLGSLVWPPEAIEKCIQLGKFVAYMRARPSQRQEETAEREFAPRLVSQHLRLAGCLAVVLNRRSVDEEVMQRVRRVAIDTARGQTFRIVKCLHEEDGAEANTIAKLTARGTSKTMELLRFLRQIRAVETFNTKVRSGISSKVKWRLTNRVSKLYEAATSDV